MTVLNQADAVYIGSKKVSAIYVGVNKVWQEKTMAYTLVASFTPGGERAGWGGTVGMTFTLNVVMYFNKIGMRCSSNTTGLQTVDLFDRGSPPTKLRSAQIDMTGKTYGEFYYVDIATITLSAGTQYYLAAETSNGWFADTGPTTLNNVSVNGCASAYGDFAGNATLSRYNEQYYGVNLGFM